MGENDFEGSKVLEKLAEVNMLDEFYEAVDLDNFDSARSYMEKAGINEVTIEIVLKKMRDADGEH